MQNGHYSIASPLAMGACIVSGTLSIATLVEPAIAAGLDFAQCIGIALAVGLVALTIATGILAHTKGLSIVGLALTVLSLAGSGIIVWEQSARRAATRDARVIVAGDATVERAHLSRKRAEAEEVLASCPKARPHDAGIKCGLREAMLAECKTGARTRCKGVQSSITVYEAAIKGYDTDLRKLPPVASGDGKADRAAVVAGLTGYSPAMARLWVSLLDPLAMPVWLEWVSIVCGIMSVGVAGVAPVASVPAVASKSSVAAVAKIGSGLPRNRPGNPGFAVETSGNFGNHAPSSVTVASDQARVLEALKKMGGEARSQDDLAQWIVVGETRGVSKGEMSKMLKRCPRIERVRVDNRHVIRISEPV